MHETPDRHEVEAAVASIPRWRHRIDVGQGVITPGSEDCATEARRLALPASFEGQRVLDVGCSDGYYSFLAEARGAREVVAIDDLSSLMNPDRRNGFSVASELLGSSVRFREHDVHDLDPGVDGVYDSILFINVLYHLRNPLLALERLAGVTAPGGSLYLKTYFHQDVRKWVRGRCIGFDVTRRAMAQFFEGTELAGDPTNWWAPNRRCLEAMLRVAGYSQVRKLGVHGDRIYYQASKP